MPPPGFGALTGDAARLAFFYGAVFAFIGILVPFWPVWLASRGLGSVEIGIVLAVIMATRVVANPVVAHYADRLGERRRLIVLMAATSIAAFALFFVTRDFWTILAVTVVFSAVRSGLMPLGESLTMLTAYEKGLDYGRLRLWGSLTFIAAAAATGRLLVGRSEDLVYWLALGAMAVTLLACLALPDARPPKAGRSRLPLRRLATNRRFALFLAAAALVQGSHGVYYAFSTLHWRAAGHSDAVIGLLWAEGVIAEVMLFAVSGAVVRRFGPAALLAMGGFAGALRWAATGLTSDLASLVVVQALHAFTFGAAHLGAMHFITRAVPASMSATAQSLYSAVVMGIGLGLAMIASGPLYGAFSGGAFHAMASKGLVGGILAAVLARLWDGGLIDEG